VPDRDLRTVPRIARELANKAARRHTHDASDITGKIGVDRLPVGTTSTTVCAGDDARLSDSRRPDAHTHGIGELTQSGATSGQVIAWDGSAWAATTPTAAAITNATAALASDVALSVSNQWYDGPSISLSAGTWLVMAHATHNRAATTAATRFLRITNKTTHYASTSEYHPSVNPNSANLFVAATIVLASTTTIYIQAATSVGSSAELLKAATVTNGSGNNATQINAIKLA
jgi:hypothetical protein